MPPISIARNKRHPGHTESTTEERRAVLAVEALFAAGVATGFAVAGDEVFESVDANAGYRVGGNLLPPSYRVAVPLSLICPSVLVIRCLRADLAA
jgi:hypothetical protein